MTRLTQYFYTAALLPRVLSASDQTRKRGGIQNRPGALRKLKHLAFTWATFSFLSACASIAPKQAVRVAQPDNTPVRNFTSFSPSLRCLDGMLASHKRPRTLISSTGFPDFSNKVKVGADEMLVNAVNQTNRLSGAYVFVDQTLEKDFGQIDLLSPTEDALTPSLYIRAGITQIDTGVVSDSGTLTLDLSNARNPLRPFNADFSSSNFSAGRDVAVVTVDMHLVTYPDKTIVPGSSVANTMVVVSDSRGFDGGGLIRLTGFDFSIKIKRVESIGQAVRNLAELGVIELLGRHARVPYWDCLNIRPANQKLDNIDATNYAALVRDEKIRRAQSMLISLGYLSGTATGRMTQATRSAISRFQADENLIENGDLNFQLYSMLSEKTLGFSKSRKPFPARKTPKSAPPIALLPDRQTYRQGDTLRLRLAVAQDGFVSCFHQTGSGPIVQILPINPKQNLRASKGSTLAVPDASAPFDIKFETSGAQEAVLCILDRDTDKKPTAGLAKKSMKPVQAYSFSEVKDFYRRKNRRVSTAEFRTRARRK